MTDLEGPTTATESEEVKQHSNESKANHSATHPATASIPALDPIRRPKTNVQLVDVQYSMASSMFNKYCIFNTYCMFNT